MRTQANAELAAERQLTQQLQQEASASQAQLRDALASSASLGQERSSLGDALAAERARVTELQAALGMLERQLAEAGRRETTQREAIAQVRLRGGWEAIGAVGGSAVVEADGGAL